MNDGVFLCTRYAFPPNALHLCGPEKQADLGFYTLSSKVSEHTREILSEFSTLYPYLQLIAGENNMSDPFDRRVVEAYWLGNGLLQTVKKNTFIAHIDDQLLMNKRISKKEKLILNQKIGEWGLPCHAFHVLHMYARTGHTIDRHTLQTMDACIINWGKVDEIHADSLTVETQALKQTDSGVLFGDIVQRTISHAGKDDVVVKALRKGDWVSYHWGKLCTKLSLNQRTQLRMYTLYALQMTA